MQARSQELQERKNAFRSQFYIYIISVAGEDSTAVCLLGKHILTLLH